MQKNITFPCSILALLILFFTVSIVRAEESLTESVSIKMILNNGQIKKVRQAEGKTVSIELTKAQKDLIKLRAPKFKGNIIRLSTEHIKSGSNKITLLIIKPSAISPILRVLPQTT